MRYINYETNEEITLKQSRTASVVKREGDVVYFTNVKSLNEIRLYELTNWFDTTYRYKDEKYNRLIILDKLDDDGLSPEIKRKELYEEAENVRLEIQRLEEELNNGNE